MFALLLAAAIETHPYYYCYADMDGDGIAADLAALCGGNQPIGASPTAPVVPSAESGADLVLRYWRDSVAGLPSPHPAILENMQLNGGIVPYADALAYCDAVLNGGWFGREGEWVVFMADGNASLREHFVIVAGLGEAIVCP